MGPSATARSSMRLFLGVTVWMLSSSPANIEAAVTFTVGGKASNDSDVWSVLQSRVVSMNQSRS